MKKAIGIIPILALLLMCCAPPKWKSKKSATLSEHIAWMKKDTTRFHQNGDVLNFSITYKTTYSLYLNAVNYQTVVTYNDDFMREISNQLTANHIFADIKWTGESWLFIWDTDLFVPVIPYPVL